MEIVLELYIFLLCLGCVLIVPIGQALRPWLAKNNRRPPYETKRALHETTSPLSVVNREAECEPCKDTYFKLHHLEQHACILPEARSLLLTFFSGALQSECPSSAILSLDRFSAASLDKFVRAELDAVTEEWHEYIIRRKAGQPRELFKTTADARRWLVRMAPVKLVDGAWLGHIHKITTPFAIRRVTKAAWQILSEELGDGTLARNHVYVYTQLLEQIGAPVPSPDSADFIQHPGMDDPRVWRSALAQMLISLFPHEFLPEILGFNLHFEMLAFETLIAVKELREIGFDPYYFTLHITIDNADSGHTAMASRIVTDYLLSIAARQGDAAAGRAWKRVQAGFILSKSLASDVSAPGGSSLAADVLAIFRAKATVANRIHGNCSVSFGGRSLGTWLEPGAFARPEWQMDFLRSLGNAKPWVNKGDRSRSRLIHLLSWGGSMFGAFTDREVAVLGDWIESLAPPGAVLYKAFTERMDMDDLPLVYHPVNYPVVPPPILTQVGLVPRRLVVDTAKLNIQRLLPLWFAHPCLLENFINVPWRAATRTGCAILRILRSQHGFLPEPRGVAGIDEMGRRDYVDLVDIGIETLTTLDASCSLPATLAEVRLRWPCPFAEMMLAMAMRPETQGWKLLGMAQAFTQLHDVMACSDLLSRRSRESLGLVAAREQKGLNDCTERLDRGDERYKDFWHGYELARREIKACFNHV